MLIIIKHRNAKEYNKFKHDSVHSTIYTFRAPPCRDIIIQYGATNRFFRRLHLNDTLIDSDPHDMY